MENSYFSLLAHSSSSYYYCISVYFIKLLPKHKNKNTRYWLSARTKTSLLLRGKLFSEFLLLKLLLINAKPYIPDKNILQTQVNSFPLSAPCFPTLCSPTLLSALHFRHFIFLLPAFVLLSIVGKSCYTYSKRHAFDETLPLW